MKTLCVGIVVVYAVMFCAAAFNIVADPEISKCLPVQPSRNFHESQITHHWKATHYSNPSYFQIDNVTCLTADIRSVDVGIQANFDLKINDTHTKASDIQVRTKTPGIYDVNSIQPNGTSVYVLHQGHLLIYGCFHYENKYEDFSLVLSKKHHPRLEVLEFFKHHVNGRDGAPKRYFHRFPETHCT